MNVPPGFGQVTPYVFAADPDAYIRFLVDGLGGVELGRKRSPDGRIANAQVRFGDSTVMVSEASADYQPSAAAFYFYVSDADTACAKAVSAGGTSIMKVEVMPYGDRQGGVRDPGGNIWWISQRLTDGSYF